jgi:hypothetical protein
MLDTLIHNNIEMMWNKDGPESQELRQSHKLHWNNSDLWEMLGLSICKVYCHRIILTQQHRNLNMIFVWIRMFWMEIQMPCFKKAKHIQQELQNSTNSIKQGNQGSGKGQKFLIQRIWQATQLCIRRTFAKALNNRSYLRQYRNVKCKMEKYYAKKFLLSKEHSKFHLYLR